MDEKKRNCGGIWVNTSKAGNKYLNLTIEIDGVKHKFVAFHNKYKESSEDNKPHYSVFPKEEHRSDEGFKDDIPF